MSFREQPQLCRNCSCVLDAAEIEKPEPEPGGGYRMARFVIGYWHTNEKHQSVVKCIREIKRFFPFLKIHRIQLCQDRMGYQLHASDPSFDLVGKDEYGAFELPEVSCVLKTQRDRKGRTVVVGVEFRKEWAQNANP